MKRLQRYYYLVGLPVLLIIVGVVLFFQEIVNTVKGNPHPQINYIIFGLIAGGCVLMLLHIRRINQEGALLGEFLESVKAQGPQGVQHTREWLRQVTGQKSFDMTDVLELVLDTHGHAVSPVQHAAIESEIAHFQAQQQRRLLLAQFLSGMMVGMGLLGTFVGLLGALEEIGKLIGSFNMGAGMIDPVTAVSELVTRLTEPMKAMGVAFSASLFGVLGALIMSMLMVFVKGASAELLSLVQSRVAWLTDLSAQTGQGGADVQPLQEALSELAQHSPLLQGLTVALDQSERRVRQLLTGLQEVASQLQQDHVVQVQTVQMLNEQYQVQLQDTRVLEQMRADQQQVMQTAQRAECHHAQWTEGLGQLHAQMQLWTEQQHRGQQSLVLWLEKQAQAQTMQGVQLRQVHESIGREKTEWNVLLKTLTELMQKTAAQLRDDGIERTELAQLANLWMQEQQARQEQLVHALLQRNPAATST